LRGKILGDMSNNQIIDGFEEGWINHEGSIPAYG
jgi:hypothetical protein